MGKAPLQWRHWQTQPEASDYTKHNGPNRKATGSKHHYLGGIPAKNFWKQSDIARLWDIRQKKKKKKLDTSKMSMS